MATANGFAEPCHYCAAPFRRGREREHSLWSQSPSTNIVKHDKISLEDTTVMDQDTRTNGEHKYIASGLLLCAM